MRRSGFGRADICPRLREETQHRIPAPEPPAKKEKSSTDADLGAAENGKGGLLALAAGDDVVVNMSRKSACAPFFAGAAAGAAVAAGVVAGAEAAAIPNRKSTSRGASFLGAGVAGA